MESLWDKNARRRGNEKVRTETHRGEGKGEGEERKKIKIKYEKLTLLRGAGLNLRVAESNFN